ncbi:protein S100-A7A-like [Limanda limanda]|uniref:protein S100-A7A-like n=1 Tax=Limanda limanda TaxID=27771 RepID=UPI0029C7F6FB|nr:protein S100-A7A-like [Limanda limanda]
MARLQGAIKGLVEVFVEYSDGDGKLNKEELKKMMEKEMDCPEAKAKMAEECDKGQGGKCKGDLDFEEFLKLVSCIAKCGYNKKRGGGAGCGK